MEIEMRTKYLQVFVFALALSLAFTTAPALAKKQVEARPAKAVELRQALRDLWVDHIFWVRNVVLSSKYGDAEAAKAAESNVVQNAKTIAGSIVPFYGKQAGDKLFELLAGHYGAVKKYMTATFANDKAGMNAARGEIMENANQIAVFLSSANPNWPRQTLESLLTTHGAHHMTQIELINRKDFSSEAVNWETMKEHMYMIADALAGGIVKQFPKKF